MNIQEYLSYRDTPFHMEQHGQTASATEIAAALDVPPRHVAKTVLIRADPLDQSLALGPLTTLVIRLDAGQQQLLKAVQGWPEVCSGEGRRRLYCSKARVSGGFEPGSRRERDGCIAADERGIRPSKETCRPLLQGGPEHRPAGSRRRSLRQRQRPVSFE